MTHISRREVMIGAGLAAAFGIDKRLAFIGPASAETPLEPSIGHYTYKVGSIEVTAVYDGIWRKPHDADLHQERQCRRHQGGAGQGGPAPPSSCRSR